MACFLGEREKRRGALCAVRVRRCLRSNWRAAALVWHCLASSQSPPPLATRPHNTQPQQHNKTSVLNFFRKQRVRAYDRQQVLAALPFELKSAVLRHLYAGERAKGRGG